MEYQVNADVIGFGTQHSTKRTGASRDGGGVTCPVMVVPGNVLCGA